MCKRGRNIRAAAWLPVIAMMFFSAEALFASQRIVIAGTGDSQELLRHMASAFEETFPDTRIEIPDSIGSSGGIRATAMGKCDLGRVARKIRARERHFGLEQRFFAYSPVVFAIHPSVNGVDNLSFEQIIAIYSGRLSSWQDLGGPEGKIYVVNREAGDSCRSVLEKKVPGFKAIQDHAGKEIYTTPEAVAVLRRYRNTIGYVPLAMIRNSTLKITRINAVEPSAANVQNGRYDLVTRLGLVWKGDLKGLSKKFVDFVFSPEGSRLIAEFGLVPADR